MVLARVFAVFLLLLLFGCANSTRVSSSSTDTVLDLFWNVGERIEAEDLVFFSVFLRHRTDRLREQLHSVSDPKSANYAKYLKMEEVCELLEVEEVAKRFEAWLAEQEGSLVVQGRGVCGDVFELSGTAAAVERAFPGTILHRFVEKENTKHVIVAALKGVMIPQGELADIIDLVHGLHLPVPYRPSGAASSPVAIGASYADATPPLIQKLYGLPGPVVGGSNTSQAVAGWQHQSYNKGDLSEFLTKYGLPVASIRHIFGDNTDFPHMESNLDTQWINSIGGIPTDFYLNKGFSFDVLDWVTLVLSQKNTSADVFSLSYGEDLDMKTVEYAKQVDNGFAKLGLLGKSVLVASGDTGAISRQSTGFAPEFPAVLPSATAVGATVLNENLTETSCVSCNFGWCSGGGFAFPGYFPNSTAPWQLKAISAYLSQSGLPDPKKWAKEAGGVGFPDVATIGTNHRIYYYHLGVEVAGTSSSCPSFAAMVSRLNHERLRVGKRTLGFLNPLFYSHPEVFNDIQIGNTGWPATPGWDATTGLGSPRYAELLSLVLSLP